MSEDEPRIIIVDDDALVRRALSRLLSAAGYDTRTFSSARELLDGIHGVGAGCLLLDVRLPDFDGLELFRELQRAGSSMPVIFLTGYGDIPMSVRAIKAGAFDFLTKPVEEKTLLEAVDSALQEYRRMRQERVETDELVRRYESLTPREVEVMHRVLAGRLNKQIAHDLGISEKTVKVHRSRVMAKMGARRVAHLVQHAVRIGILARGVEPRDEARANATGATPARGDSTSGDRLVAKRPDGVAVDEFR